MTNFYGQDGNDLITSGTFQEGYGGAGDDYLASSGMGVIYIEGGAGNDTLFFNSGEGRWGTIYGGDSNDLLEGSDGSGHIDRLYGGSGDDYVHGNTASGLVLSNDYIDGGTGRDDLRGGGGNDTLYGGDGDDSGAESTAGFLLGEPTLPGLYGGAGDDYCDGGNGKDLLVGGAGNDIMIGGFGNDRYITDSTGDQVVEHAGGGFDTVLALASLTLAPDAEVEVLQAFVDGGAMGLTLTGSNTNNEVGGDKGNNILSGLGGDDALYGLAGADHLDGGLGNDTVFAGKGIDTLLGGSGRDTLYGDADDDRLNGGLDADVLDGGEGADVLLGGAGKDRLTGGAGLDVFVFNTAPHKSTNVDVITDFARMDDTIHLDNKYLKKVGPNGKLKSDAFHLGKKAADAEDRVIYDKGTGALYYDADGTGKIAAIKIAVLQNKPAVGLSDFIII
jgi:Ca2+-binding RTX toxin-like protein